MIRLLCIAAALALAGCGPTVERVDVAALQPCSDLDLTTGELNPSECRLEAGGETLHVTFAPVAPGATGGTVTVDVLGEDGSVVQTLSEPEVSEYLHPSVQDVDGDGRADILIARESGNVNIAHGVWIFSGERGAYQRVGEVSGVEVARTNEGYIAVPARSGAANWVVGFYRLDEGGLHPIVSLDIEATDVTDDGRVLRQTCSIEEAPGLRDINLTEEAAREKFCAEPAAGVFQ